VWQTYSFECFAFVRKHNATHPDPKYTHLTLHIGSLSRKANAFKGDVVFNNATLEDLTLDSTKHAYKGSREKSPAFMMGFLECCSPSRGMVVDLNISTGIAPTSYHVFVVLANYHSCLYAL
jgi:hypothetical protein